MLPAPINFDAWIREHQHLLQPPVNNYCVYQGNDFIVMAIGGPNARTDFHINQTEEWFYQWKGKMCLRVASHPQDPINHTGPVEFQDIIIEEGQMFLLPGNTPHSPIRFADTIGLVIERFRTAEHTDKLRWYCEQCTGLVHEESFRCEDIVNQLKLIMQSYSSNVDLRTCKACGHVNPTK